MKKRSTSTWVLGLATAATLTAMVTGCDPVPRRTLSVDEKIADLYWVYSQFGENYAPLDYKQKRYNFNYEALKSKYLEETKKTTTNEAFYDLMFQFVSEFKDAHTSAALANSSLPNRAKVAFLGFSGSRNEDYLLVKSVLPTNSAESNYPIKVGDKITAVNGKTLKEVVDAEMVKFRDLGFSEANYTYHFNKIFNRSSTVNGLPKDSEITLTVKRGTKEAKVKMPWVIKDVVTFQQEQAAAAAAAKKPAPTTQPENESLKTTSEPKFTGNLLMYSDDLKRVMMKFGFIGFDGRVEMPGLALRDLSNKLKHKMTDTFRLPDFISEWQMADGEKVGPAVTKEPLDKLAELRKVLADAIYVSGSKTYPAYVAPVDLLDRDGKKTGEKKLVAYVYIDTFSPSEETEAVMKEFKATLATFKNLGVRDVIIDTINNGGGSLELGMKLAQALTPTKIEQPLMQFRLSDTWLDEFHSDSLTDNDEASKEYARRMYLELSSELSAGNRLSRPYSAETLYRYTIEPNSDLESAFRVKLLVNEMCASMCDMFAGIIQDNQLGQIVGTRSMGAGGNVVNHTQAPNSHIEVRQTESLMLRATAPGVVEDTVLGGIKYTYVENNGATPDVAIEVVKSAKDKYEAVINKAVELIVKKAF